jgi:hypothetical protein
MKWTSRRKSTHAEPSSQDFQAVNDVAAYITIVWFLGEIFEGFTKHLPYGIRVHRAPYKFMAMGCQSALS